MREGSWQRCGREGSSCSPPKLGRPYGLLLLELQSDPYALGYIVACPATHAPFDLSKSNLAQHV